MEADLKNFSNTAKGFTKSPLGIIALFIVLVYGFATLATTFGDNLKEYLTPLIYFLVFFPVIVLFGFLWLVSKHHDKIYGPSDFKNEDIFLEMMKMKMSTVASLAVASSKQSEETNSTQNIQDQLNSIVELVSKTSHIEPKSANTEWKNKILWVDDRPENNIFERNAFEAQGLKISLALSTQEALNILEYNKYAVIISDMGRKEGNQEGYVLLDILRRAGNQTPFFIYAGSNLQEHKKQALERGAQGSTNNAQELFQQVMNVIIKTNKR